MKSIEEIIQMASNVQAELQKAQEGLDRIEVEGVSGGGLVKVVATATGRIVREMLPKAHFATIYAKPSGRPMVDTFITEVSQDTWILFPWDTEPQYVQPIAGRTSARA